MENSLKQFTRIDLNDGQIQSIELIDNGALVLFKNWKEELIRFHFRGVHLFKAVIFGGDLGSIELREDTEQIKEAKRNWVLNGDTLADLPRLYQASFHIDIPVVTIVFEELVIGR
jgi:hypothetical protein